MTGAPVTAQKYICTSKGLFCEEQTKQGGTTEPTKAFVLEIFKGVFLYPKTKMPVISQKEKIRKEGKRL